MLTEKKRSWPAVSHWVSKGSEAYYLELGGQPIHLLPGHFLREISYVIDSDGGLEVGLELLALEG